MPFLISKYHKGPFARWKGYTARCKRVMRRGNTAKDMTQLDQKKDHADGGQVLMNITKYGQAVYHIKEMGVYGVTT